MKKILSTTIGVTLILFGVTISCKNDPQTPTPSGLVAKPNDSTGIVAGTNPNDGARENGSFAITIKSQPTSIAWGQIFSVTVNVKNGSKAQAMVPVNVSLKSGNGAISSSKGVTDANGNATINLKITDKIEKGEVKTEGLGNHIIRFEASSAVVDSKSINVTIPAGWSDVTGFRHTWTANQAAILKVAKTYLGRGKAPASIDVSGKTWLLDTDDGDGARIRAAMNVYSAYRLNAKNPAKPTEAIVKSMKKELSKDNKVGYTNLNDQTLLVNRIVERFASYNILLTGTLEYLGILAQCKETRDRILRDAVGRSAVYGGGTALAASKVRAGVVGNQDKNHTFIVSAVKWDAKGNPITIRMIDSNFGDSFNRPKGDIPWNRQMREHEKPISYATSFEIF